MKTVFSVPSVEDMLTGRRWLGVAFAVLSSSKDLTWSISWVNRLMQPDWQMPRTYTHFASHTTVMPWEVLQGYSQSQEIYLCFTVVQQRSPLATIRIDIVRDSVDCKMWILFLDILGLSVALMQYMGQWCGYYPSLLLQLCTLQSAHSGQPNVHADLFILKRPLPLSFKIEGYQAQWPQRSVARFFFSSTKDYWGYRVIVPRLQIESRLQLQSLLTWGCSRLWMCIWIIYFLQCSHQPIEQEDNVQAR